MTPWRRHESNLLIVAAFGEGAAMGSNPQLNGTGIGDLRRRQPADETMRNLLELSREKLDLCARLPVFELEAANEGHVDAAQLFQELLDVERASFDLLKARLFSELEATAGGGLRSTAPPESP